MGKIIYCLFLYQYSEIFFFVRPSLWFTSWTICFINACVRLLNFDNNNLIVCAQIINLHGNDDKMGSLGKDDDDEEVCSKLMILWNQISLGMENECIFYLKHIWLVFRCLKLSQTRHYWNNYRYSRYLECPIYAYFLHHHQRWWHEGRWSFTLGSFGMARWSFQGNPQLFLWNVWSWGPKKWCHNCSC